MGHSATLQAGEVQRMTAGTGIVHSEINQSEDACRLLQIWIEPSRPGIAPSYDQRAFPLAEGWTALVDPEGLGGAMVIQRPVRLWRACPGAGARLDLRLSPKTQGWIQVIAGSLAVGAQADLPSSIAVPGSMAQGDGLGFRAGQLVSLTAGSQGADLLLFELS
jgi:redox-sensitive bicupin YhaK (pirin superfamily)